MFMLRFFTLFMLLFAGQLWAEVKINDATVRLLPPGVPNTAAYFSIENNSDKDVVLVAAKADFVNKAEIHNHLMIDNMMSMQQQAEVVVAAGETVDFKPSGLHIMLFGLQQVLSEDQTVALSLYTKSGEVINFTAKVARPQTHAHH
jgi:hypothetical protein